MICSHIFHPVQLVTHRGDSRAFVSSSGSPKHAVHVEVEVVVVVVVTVVVVKGVEEILEQ